LLLHELEHAVDLHLPGAQSDFAVGALQLPAPSHVDEPISCDESAEHLALSQITLGPWSAH
jgi:hypothetical protein